MDFVKKTNRRVILAAFMSVVICNLIYTFLIPAVMNFSKEITIEFYKKMIIACITISPFAVFFVYIFYLPVRNALTELVQKGSVSTQKLDKAQKAFNNIFTVTFFVGATAYLIGLVLNFSIDILKGNPVEVDNFVCRFFTAISWGILNGIVAARILNLFLIDAKLKLRIVNFSDYMTSHKSNSGFRFFISGFIFFFFLVSFFGVLFYQQFKYISRQFPSLMAEKITENIFNLKDFTKFLVILFLLFVIVTLLYAIIVYEIYQTLKSIRNQVLILNKDEMDLSQRIKIISFDDIGEISAGINKFIEKLSDTVNNIKSLSSNVFEHSVKTKDSISECTEKTQDLSRILKEVERMVRIQTDVVETAIKVVHSFVDKLDNSLIIIQNQVASVDTTAESIKVIWNFIQKISSKINEMKGFIQNLSELIKKGLENVEKTLQASISIQNTGDKVSEIARMIESIAEESSILAMNAAIEAAHAGEYGIGFSVVAQEMRKLAESTSESTRKIKNLMDEMKEKNTVGLSVSRELKSYFNNLATEFKNNEVKFNEINEIVVEESNIARKGMSELDVLLKITHNLKEHSEIMKQEHKSLESSVGNLNELGVNLLKIQKNLEEGIKFIESVFKNIFTSFDVSFQAIEALQKEIEKYKVI
jgi:methyl-accepting chemotaxis protein